MKDRLYLYNKADHLLVGGVQEKTHLLAEAAFVDKYIESFRGIPLYMDVEVEYENAGARIHTEVYAWLGNGFLINSEGLHEWIPDLYFVMRRTTSKFSTWANPAFIDKFPKGRHENIIDTYPSCDTIHSLYVRKSDITNKNSKQVLTTLQ